MSKTLLPESLYVTYRYENPQDLEARVKLGFMSPEGTDSGAAKRKITQQKWAYGAVTTDPVTGVMKRFVQRKWEPSVGHTYDQVPITDDLLPTVLTNELLEGFQIARSVRRGGWSGANILWRIIDPRGFELEISTANFARIVDCAVVDHGVIQGKCIWGRCGSENILLPESSDIYQAAVMHTDRSATRVPLTEVNIGDTVDVYNASGYDGHGIYLGRHYYTGPVSVQVTEPVSLKSINRGFNTSRYQPIDVGMAINDRHVTQPETFRYQKATRQYLVYMLDSKRILARNSITVSSIVSKAPEGTDPIKLLQKYSSVAVESSGTSWRPRYLYLADPKPIKHDKIELRLSAELPDSQINKWISIPSAARPNLVVEYNGSTWLTVAAYHLGNAADATTQRLAKVTLSNSGIQFEPVSSEVAALFGGNKSRYVTIDINENEIHKLNPRQLELVYNGNAWAQPTWVDQYLFASAR